MTLHLVPLKANQPAFSVCPGIVDKGPVFGSKLTTVTVGLSLADDHGVELLGSWIVRVTGNTLYGNWAGRPVARPRQLPGVHWGQRQHAVGAIIPTVSGSTVENIVLAVARAPGKGQAWARGILVKYTSGGQDYSLLTGTRIAIVTRVSQCTALVKRITGA
ncbi:MAG TPA: hypothetical protein VFI65_04225 [Streptosporangiaceae bacterium]|nr:hypothetical protein [Streptosporangiaceae bacterium]